MVTADEIAEQLGEVLNLEVKAFAVPRAGWAEAFAPFARGLIESAERSVCFNVSGLGGSLLAKMEIRALRSS